MWYMLYLLPMVRTLLVQGTVGVEFDFNSTPWTHNLPSSQVKVLNTSVKHTGTLVLNTAEYQPSGTSTLQVPDAGGRQH
jgi:hypothetical protein